MDKIFSKVAFSHKSASFFVYLCNESKKNAKQRGMAIRTALYMGNPLESLNGD